MVVGHTRCAVEGCFGLIKSVTGILIVNVYHKKLKLLASWLPVMYLNFMILRMAGNGVSGISFLNSKSINIVIERVQFD